MAPSPETDNTPKAPDKSPKGHKDAQGVDKEISVTSLDDGQLKALLDEAITYKTPRDREGKSELFKVLLTDAEDELRKDSAKTASGSELARYYNTTANRRRNKRQPSSISENLTHGGSLNDLLKEELYESASHLQRPKKNPVSARQREGGSLPCNVNAGASSIDNQFFIEEQAKRRNRNISEKMEYTAIDMESECLLENDQLGQEYSCGGGGDMDVVQPRLPRVQGVYTSKATLQISGVDEHIPLPFDRADKSGYSRGLDDNYKDMQLTTPHYGLLTLNNNKYIRTPVLEEKKVDENGNALAASSTHASSSSASSSLDIKKRKKSAKKTEDGIRAEHVKGHRADIIDNVDLLVEYISGGNEGAGDRPKGTVKSKLHKHMSEDKGKQSKQRTRSKGSKGAGTHSTLQKSNSLEEVSITKLEDFNFDTKETSSAKSESSKVPLSQTKSNAERPRDRKSWALCPELYQNASAENLENADFTFVTKKKKSKKRRNSLGSRKQVLHGGEARAAEFHRVPSPRRKSACSAPHSEKSIDSSDADSVNSLFMDYGDDMEQLNQPVSYADIAKSAEKPKCTKSTEKKKKEPEKTPVKPEPVIVEKEEVVETVSPTKPLVVKNDLNSMQNWPEIRNNKVNQQASIVGKKGLDSPLEWPTIHNSNNGFREPSVGNDNKLKNNAAAVTTTVPRNNNNKPINTVKNNRRPGEEVQHPEIAVPVVTNNINDNNLLNSAHQLIRKMSEQQKQKFDYQNVMPPNIRDVQSIEKMQYKSLHNANYPNGGREPITAPVVVATAAAVPPPQAPPAPKQHHCQRPAVVILSGGDKHVTDITFGFDINEQLLSGDVCSDFVSRFFVPETPMAVQVEQLVDYIGAEWEDVLVQSNSGKVHYYKDLLDDL